MEQKLISFEETQKKVDELSVGGPAQDLCGYYKIARPILNLIMQILPEKWGKILEMLMKYLDEHCHISS